MENPISLIKWEFFQAVVMSVPWYSCTTWILMKCLEKKLDENDVAYCFEQILEAAVYITAVVQLLTSHLTYHPSKINKTCCAVLAKQWQTHKWYSPIDTTHRQTSVEQPAKTDMHQLCVDTGCHVEDLLRMMTDKDRLWESFKGICTISMPWWWWEIIKSCYLWF